MLTNIQPYRLPCMIAAAAVAITTGANAQVCDDVAVDTYIQVVEADRQVDATRIVNRVVFRNDENRNYMLEFFALRTDLPNTSERWKVTFENSEEFDYVRRLDIDSVWMHTFRTRVIDGMRHVMLEVPGASVEINRNDQPGEPKFEAFLDLIAETASHREAISIVMVGNFPHWDFAVLECVADCTSDEDLCGYLPVCFAPTSPTVCQCWDAYECCMSENVAWHVCASNCICVNCYAGFVEECCAHLEAVQISIEYECERELIDCLTSQNLQPCVAE